MKADTRLIQLMIIGAEKAGTTSLLRWIGEHPEVCIHSSREMGYFILDEQYQSGSAYLLEHYFSGCDPSVEMLAGKSVELLHSAVGLARLREHNPAVKLVAVLRDPVDRAYSGYWEARRRGSEKALRFEDAVFVDDHEVAVHSAYIQRGIYADALDQVLQLFSHEQLRIFIFEDLIRNPLVVCDEIFDFIGAKPGFEPSVSVAYNASAEARVTIMAKVLYSRTTLRPFKNILRMFLPPQVIARIRRVFVEWNERPLEKPGVSEETRSKLARFYEDYNKDVARKFGLDLSSWSTPQIRENQAG